MYYGMAGRIDLDTTFICGQDPTGPIPSEKNPRESSSGCRRSHKWDEHARYTLLLRDHTLLIFFGSLYIEGLRGDFDEFDGEAS
jgi:hypothetical protein